MKTRIENVFKWLREIKQTRKANKERLAKAKYAYEIDILKESLYGDKKYLPENEEEFHKWYHKNRKQE